MVSLEDHLCHEMSLCKQCYVPMKRSNYLELARSQSYSHSKKKGKQVLLLLVNGKWFLVFFFESNAKANKFLLNVFWMLALLILITRRLFLHCFVTFLLFKKLGINFIYRISKQQQKTCQKQACFSRMRFE